MTDPIRPFRSLAVRLATGYAAFFVLSVLLILGATFALSTREQSHILRATIRADFATLEAGWSEGGAAGLRRAADDLAERASTERYLALLGGDGNLLAGNLPAELWQAGWSKRTVLESATDGARDLAQAAAENPDGEVLLITLGGSLGPFRAIVGRNGHVLDETQEIILSAMMWGAGGAGLLALLGGLLVARGPVRRVEEIARTTRLVSEGQLGLTVPGAGADDEIGRLAADIDVMLRRIETLMASLRQVSYDIAHDLRTPLARLRQGLDAARGGDDPVALRSAIEDALAEADTAIETFNALLGIAQIEAGSRRERFRPIDLSEICDDVLDIYTDVAADEGHRLERGSLEAVTVEGDRELVVRALVNLVENAINHVPAPARIVVSCGLDHERGFIEVADDGPGVPEAEREAIFRRLYRLDRSRSTPGHGLGLSMAAAIAELHGGTAEAFDNRPGLRVRLTFERR